MSDLQGRTPGEKGSHYDFITSRIPAPLKNASLPRIKELDATQTAPLHWITRNANFDHTPLQEANLKLWASQNKVDRLLDELQDIYTFAEPLLTAELKKQYGVDDDVKTTYLHLYLPKEQPWYVIDVSGGVVVRNVSLLDAALMNFALSETCTADSDFISQPDVRGQFDIKPIKRKMSIAQFQALCRELDIGARYTAHIKSFLLPADAAAKATLRQKVIDSDKAAFTAAVHLAAMTGDIQPDTSKLVLMMLEGQRNLTLKGKIVQFGELSLMDIPLTGIVLITPDLEQTRDVAQVIAYVPQDPDHPLKEYPTVTDFLNELTRQFRDNKLIASRGMTYRQYFSQFVDQHERGHFFGGLQQRLFRVQWHKKEHLDQRPTWRDEPLPTPNLQFGVTPVTGEFWGHRYQKKLDKVLNDARHVAVSTADTDSSARWAWWDNFKKIVSDIFNVALMVATPFVPGLGELMMAYTAYQITNDVVESIVDLAEGLWIEAADHIVAVVTNVVQLGIFAAGVEFGKVAGLRLSPFIEGLKPVVLPDGQPRLWHPDLTPYALADIKLPAGAKPDALGLHAHAGEDILPLDTSHYAVQKDAKTGNYRVKHPHRSNAYLPELNHNGFGAWTHEAETPRAWESTKLMRRLGHSVDGFSDAELQRIRITSGIEDNSLRHMHVDNTPPPPLLADSLKRSTIARQIRENIENIRSGRPLDPTSYWLESLPTRLPGWPSDKALKVYQNGDTSPFRQYGNAAATPEQTLATHLSHIMSGQLPQSLVDFLSEDELKTLLGPQTAKGERVQVLRNLLAGEADRIKPEIFKQRYQVAEASDNPSVQLLRSTFPELPKNVAQTLLARASHEELERITQHKKIPLRLKQQAREAAFEVRASHAYEGFRDSTQRVPDTEKLVLNSLRIHTDTFSDLRIEIHQGTYDGVLRCSVGGADARTVRLLVSDEHEKYEVRDSANNKLHDATDFYEAVLNALPADKRTQLGYRTGQGRMFQQWVMVKTEAPAERRTALAAPPIRATPDLETELLLRGPGLSIVAATPEEMALDIYPHFSEREVTTFVRSLGEPVEALRMLKTLDRELEDLHVILNQWRYQQPEGWGPGASSFRDEGGQHITERLIECFQRKPIVFGERSTTVEEGYALDLSLEMGDYDLESWWKKLPDIQHYLAKVTTLNLDRTTFNAGSDGLLKHFPNLQQLSARRCRLTQLPDGIGKLHFLRTLRLMGNQIRLTPTAVEHLRTRTRMETLRLDDNPTLGRLPNVGNMPRLKVLSLSNTGATTWPDGLLDPSSKVRHRGFYLDLQENPLARIPTVIAGSDAAFIIARTRLFERDLSDMDRIVFEEYRKSVGINPTQIYTDAANDAISQWPMSDDAQWWSNEVAGLGTFREEAWHELMGEPDASGFFSVITKLTRSADYLAGREPLKQLSARVWRMIEAMDLDTDLRKELFQMATAPTTCADAGAQLFNNMGIKVLASEAYALSTSAEILESKLVTLAKGAARLARVDDIARADFGSRAGVPDEVEVYLAYETGLAQRLGLPWQSERMLHRLLAGVSTDTLDTAFDTVVSMEDGDGLVNDMIDQPFWDKYLRDTHSRELMRNAEHYDRRTALLDQRHDALDANAITDEVYEQLLNDIGYARKQLNRTLTREALQRAEQ